jgi:outer membrane receptor protein involved in Fe transport
MAGMTVSASRFRQAEFEVPASVSITPRRRFYERDFSSTAEVLREEPGVMVQKTTHGHGAPIVRGLIGKQVLLLYDGIRLNKPTFRSGGNQYLNTIDLEALDRIEVIRGPTSVLYGSDALGGAVNLIPGLPTAVGSSLTVTPSAGTRYSSADNGRAAHLRLSLGDAETVLQTGASYKKIGDLRGGGDIGKQIPTGWEEYDFFTRLYRRFDSRTQLRIEYLGVRQEDVPRYDKYEAGEFDQYSYDPQNRDLVTATFESELSRRLPNQVKIGLSYQHEQEGKRQQKRGSDNRDYTLTEIGSWGGYLQLSAAPNTQHDVIVGAEYYYDEVNSFACRNDTISIRAEYPDGSEYISAGVFARDEIELVPLLTLMLGVRYSWFVMKSSLEPPFGCFDQEYQDLTGAAAITCHLDSNLNLIGRWSRGFRAPNLNDAVVLKYSSSGVDAPSTDLNPEYSDNFEIGAKLRNEQVRADLFLFYNLLNDLIDRTPGTYEGKSFFDENNNGSKDDNEFDIYQRRNVADSRIYGVEFQSQVSLGPCWQTRTTLAWTWGDNQTQSEPLSRIPPLLGLVACRWNPDAPFWVEAYGRFAGPQRRLSQRDRDDTRIEPGGTDGWFSINLRGQYRFGQLALNAGLANLTDQAYKEHGSGIYSPGRNLTLAISYNLD